MDAALITGKFNFGLGNLNNLSKDVTQKTDSSFKDIFSKNIEKEKGVVEKKENNKNIKDDVDEKGSLENTKTVDKDEKAEKMKEREKTKDKKNVKDEAKETTEKINVLAENILGKLEEADVKEIGFEDVKELLDVENISLTDEEMSKVQEVVNEGLLQNVIEVGPQNVETEKITFNEYDDLEKKLESLCEEIGDSDSEMKETELKSEETGSEFNDELNSDLLSSFEDGNSLKNKTVKNKEGRNTGFEFNKKGNVEGKLEQFDVGTEKIDFKIADVKTENVSDILMNRTADMQEQIDVIKQVAEHVDVNVLEDKSEMIIKLKPDHLGKVTVEIAVENGNVTAKFLAESRKVKEILEANMQDLKDHLASQGMVVQDLSVSVGNDGRGPLFDQNNYSSFKKRQKIEEVNNEGFYAEDDEFGFNELKSLYYYPDSTVSYSA